MKNFLESRNINESKSDINFDALEKLRTEMNVSVDAAFENIENRSEAVSQIRRIFEHSVNDGMRLGQQHGLTPDEWFHIVSDTNVIFKHPKFIRLISGGVQRKNFELDSITKNREDNKNTRNKFSQLFDKIFQRFDTTSDSIIPDVETKKILETENNNQEFSKIDNYYAEILSSSKKNIIPKRHEQKSDYTGTTNEKNAKDYLAGLQPWLKGQYHSMPILEKVYGNISTDITDKNYLNLVSQTHKDSDSDLSQQEFINRSKTDKNIQESIARYYLSSQSNTAETKIKIQQSAFFDTETLDDIKGNTPTELHADFDTNRYQKLGVVYNQERRGLEQPLIKEIQEKLNQKLGREYRVELDENDRYIVKDTLETERVFSEQDRIEFAAAYNHIDTLYKKVNETEGFDYNPIISNELKEKYSESADVSENIPNQEYIEHRMEILKEKDIINAIPLDCTDQLTYSMLSNFKDELVESGEYNYAMAKIDSLVNVPEKYIQELKGEFKESQNIIESKNTAKIKDREIFNIKKLNISYLGTHTIINGKITFAAERDEGGYAIIQDGEQIGESYKYIGDLSEINGKMTFIARIDEDNYAIIHDGEQIGESYKFINHLSEIKGKITFAAKRGENWTIIHDGEQIGESYKYIDNLSEINGKITFIARIDEDNYAIIHGGEQIGESYKNIFNFSKEDNFLKLIIHGGTSIREISIPLDSSQGHLDEELNLLNAVHNPNLESVDKIIGEELPKSESLIDEMKKEFESSWAAAKFVTNQIKHNAREMLSFNSVKKTRAENRTRTQLQQLLIPDVYAALTQERNKKTQKSWGEHMESWMDGESSGSSSIEPRAADYLESNRESVGYMGGNSNEKLGVVSARHQLRQSYLATGYYAAENSGTWAKSYIPLDTAPSGISRENTLTTARVTPGARVNLPLPVHSSYIEMRVKSIDTNGNETPIEITIDSLGQGHVIAPNDAEKITYSISESMINETPSDISEIEFQKTKKDIISQASGENYFKKIPGIADQDRLFVQSIESKPPKEKIKAIEKYVQEIGYYDFDNNDEVVAPKRNADSEELFYLMEDRMNQLRAQNPDIDYGKKRYAGVCDDYSKLTTALLREAGIPSGIMHGFRSGNGIDVTVGNAHGASIVLWRGSTGTIKPYIVDGTPTGMNTEEQEKMSAMGINPETIEEKEQANEEIFEQLREQAEQEIKDVENALRELTPESIAELSNGKLENALNMVLAHDVSWKHVEALESVLSAYRYTPLYKSLGTKNSDTVAQKFLQQQIESTVSTSEYAATHGGSAGSALFTMVKDFIRKENKSGAHGIDDSEKITELIKPSLSANEYRSLVIINNYLKAKKILS